MSSSNFKGFSAVDVKTLRITSLVTNKTADITRLVKSLEIYQSLFDPTMVGIVELDDATSIIYDLPLLGEEFISIEFATEDREPFAKTFWVRKVSDIERASSIQKQRITLNIVSMEQLRGISYIVDKGYNAHISTIAEVLLKYALRTKSEVEVEQTRGSEKLIIPSWTLWDTLEFLRTRAVSSTYDSPYLFFEDTLGFKFVSVEHLVSSKKAANAIPTITAEPFNLGAGEGPDHVSIRTDQYRNAENFRIISKGDTSSFMNEGGLSSRTQVYDVIKKRMVNYDMDFKKFGSEVVKEPMASSYISHHSDFLYNIIDKPVQRYMLPLDSSNKTEFVKNVGRRVMFNKHLSDTIIGFSLYGDSQLTVGDLVNVVIPRVYDAGDDQQLSGLYMIGRLKHSLSDDQLFTHVEAHRYGHNERTFDIQLSTT